MLVYPVLDLKEGLVVRAVAGERERYRPVTSRLAGSARPVEVARAFRRRLGLERLYLADLDSIAGGEPCLPLYRQLADEGFRLLVDAGIRSVAEAEALRGSGVDEVVAALETLPSPAVLGSLVSAIGPDRLVFSLDIKSGQPLGDRSTWPAKIETVARLACDQGVTRVLVLDLAAVGSAGGPIHLDLCRTLVEDSPDLRLLTGGGVRGPRDLQALAKLGAESVLVSSALHDGKLTAADLESIAES